jgi:hypothetical protein
MEANIIVRQNYYWIKFIIALILVGSAVFLSCGDEGEPLTPMTDGEMLPDDGDQDTDDMVAEQPEALPGLPDYTAGFETWLKMNAEPIVGGSPAHFGTKDILVNQERAAIAPDGEQKFPYPDGSIIVKPVFRSDDDFIGIFALMQKEAGSNPAANDWTFIEYSRRDKDAAFTVLAKGKLCEGCHSGVQDTDYVFQRLE